MTSSWLTPAPSPVLLSSPYADLHVTTPPPQPAVWSRPVYSSTLLQFPGNSPSFQTLQFPANSSQFQFLLHNQETHVDNTETREAVREKKAEKHKKKKKHTRKHNANQLAKMPNVDLKTRNNLNSHIKDALSVDTNWDMKPKSSAISIFDDSYFSTLSVAMPSSRISSTRTKKKDKLRTQSRNNRSRRLFRHNLRKYIRLSRKMRVENGGAVPKSDFLFFNEPIKSNGKAKEAKKNNIKKTKVEKNRRNVINRSKESNKSTSSLNNSKRPYEFLDFSNINTAALKHNSDKYFVSNQRNFGGQSSAHWSEINSYGEKNVKNTMSHSDDLNEKQGVLLYPSSFNKENDNSVNSSNRFRKTKHNKEGNKYKLVYRENNLANREDYLHSTALEDSYNDIKRSNTLQTDFLSKYNLNSKSQTNGQTSYFRERQASLNNGDSRSKIPSNDYAEKLEDASDNYENRNTINTGIDYGKGIVQQSLPVDTNELHQLNVTVDNKTHSRSSESETRIIGEDEQQVKRKGQQEWNRLGRLVFVAILAGLGTVGNIFAIAAIITDVSLRKTGTCLCISDSSFKYIVVLVFYI